MTAIHLTNEQAEIVADSIENYSNEIRNKLANKEWPESDRNYGQQILFQLDLLYYFFEREKESKI